MEQPAQQPQQSPEQPEGSAVKADVMAEVAGGYVLASTIMSFLALWAVGVMQLNYV